MGSKLEDICPRCGRTGAEKISSPDGLIVIGCEVPHCEELGDEIHMPSDDDDWDERHEEEDKESFIEWHQNHSE